MKRVLTCFAIVAIAYCTPVAQARAQTTEQMQQLGAWSSALQGIIAELIASTENLPKPPRADLDDAERRVWAEGARAWGRQSLEKLTALEGKASQLAPPPEVAVVQALMQPLNETRLRMPEAISRTKDLARSYISLADAFEHRQADAIIQIRAGALDAAVLNINLFHDINVSQAAAISSAHPQSALLMSYARSYEGFAALMQLKRDFLVNGQGDRAATATRMESAAEQMRVLIVTGRADARMMQAQFADPSQMTPSDVAFLPRLQAMLATYPGSFDREAAAAAELQEIAVLLRDSRDFAAVEPSIDQHMMVFGDLDTQRLSDTQRRQALLAQ